MLKEPIIKMENVSRWYGEVLGVNRITATVPPGVTGLLGPNGAGKSTLMNVITGLIRASQGNVTVFGEPIWNNPGPLRRMGYCAQHDSFYERMTGYEFLYNLLSIRGYDKKKTHRLSVQALERVNLAYARDKRIGSYSKGMRQRVKVALALADNPDILILDEPLNGLDAVGRREMMDLFRSYGKEERNVLISSHILHEIESMTDNILMLRGGYLLAEGEVREVRDLLRKHPHKIYVRCDDQRRMASLLMLETDVASVRLDLDGQGLICQSYDLDHFYRRLNELVLDEGLGVSLVTVSDENIQSVFSYLTEIDHDRA